jgi:hypothetical protein
MSEQPVVIRTYADLRRAIAARRRELGCTQLEMDKRAGLPSGYTGKVEGRTRCFGPLSLELTLQTLKAELVLRPRAA